MKSKGSLLWKILLAAGSLLLAVSITFLTVSLVRAGRIRVDCGAAVGYMESVLPPTVAGVKEERGNNAMPAVTYDGQDYVALLTVSGRAVKLPVRASWDKTAVKKVPCVFTGNPYEGTLIIGGVDDAGQLDFISKIDIGDVLTVTDMKGCEFTYTVSTVKHAKDAKASTLISDQYDLTVFAKDRRSGDWLLVRCNMG